MATVGRAFGFYLRYWQQMQACYEDDAPLGPSSTEDTPEMILKVGNCACEQVAKFLTTCGEEIEKHYSENLLCRTSIRTRPGTMEKYWEVDLRLGRNGSRKSGRIRWTTGAFVGSGNDPDPSLFLYFWVRGSKGQGGRQAEEDLVRLLSEKRVKARAAIEGWDQGTVAYAKIPLKEKVAPTTFDIQEGDLLREVKRSLKAIRKTDLEKLFEI